MFWVFFSEIQNSALTLAAYPCDFFTPGAKGFREVNIIEFSASHCMNCRPPSTTHFSRPPRTVTPASVTQVHASLSVPVAEGKSPLFDESHETLPSTRFRFAPPGLNSTVLRVILSLSSLPSLDVACHSALQQHLWTGESSDIYSKRRQDAYHIK